MDAALDDTSGELARLRGCLDDLVSIMALTALWSGGELHHIAISLADSLLEMLDLAVVVVRLTDDDGRTLDTTRVADWRDGPDSTQVLGDALTATLGTPPDTWAPPAQIDVAGRSLAIASARLGLHGELGVVVAGALRATFPEQTERLLLDVAANQAAFVLQQARLRSEQRRDQERESRAILDSIPGLTAVLGADGGVDVVNHQIVDYTGQTLEELKNWGTNGTVHAEDLPHVAAIFMRSIATGVPYEIEQRLRRHDGAYRWFNNRGFPVRDGAGRVVRWYVLLTDVDERRRAEEALKASERDLKLIIDTIPAVAWSARPDGSAEYFNRPYLDFVGLAADEVKDWGWTASVHPDDLTELVTTWQRIIASNVPGEGEARLRRHDGTYRWFLFRASPLRDEHGTIVKWYGITTDINDRKRAETELKRSEMLLAEGLRLSATGTFSWHVDTDELLFSDELRRIFEFDQSTVTFDRVAERVHPEDLGLLAQKMEEVRSGQDNEEYEIRLRTPSQQTKYLRVFGRLLRHPHGRLECVGAVQDVTRRRHAEDALDQARSELTHVARVTSLSTLAASIAHEVNQPLSGIITNAGTCLRMLDAAPPNIEGARETAKRTIRDGRRASDVIARLRDLFSKKTFTLEPLDLNETTREVLALSAGNLQRRRVILQSDLADGLPPVTGDRVQLQQVILNLLLNASDAMAAVDDRPREVLVRTERHADNAVRVSVRDAGVGIDPDDMDKLYDAFYTTKSGGMGIGLFVSRSIVERHHGRLWAERNSGPGATFSFAIPFDARDEANSHSPRA